MTLAPDFSDGAPPRRRRGAAGGCTASPSVVPELRGLPATASRYLLRSKDRRLWRVGRVGTSAAPSSRDRVLTRRIRRKPRSLEVRVEVRRETKKRKSSSPRFAKTSALNRFSHGCYPSRCEYRKVKTREASFASVHRPVPSPGGLAAFRRRFPLAGAALHPPLTEKPGGVVFPEPLDGARTTHVSGRQKMAFRFRCAGAETGQEAARDGYGPPVSRPPAWSSTPIQRAPDAWRRAFGDRLHHHPISRLREEAVAPGWALAQHIFAEPHLVPARPALEHASSGGGLSHGPAAKRRARVRARGDEPQGLREGHGHRRGHGAQERRRDPQRRVGQTSSAREVPVSPGRQRQAGAHGRCPRCGERVG